MKTKLKDLKWEIPGSNSNRPLVQCLEAVGIGFLFPLVVAIIVRVVDYLISGT